MAPKPIQSVGRIAERPRPCHRPKLTDHAIVEIVKVCLLLKRDSNIVIWYLNVALAPVYDTWNVLPQILDITVWVRQDVPFWYPDDEEVES